MTPPEAEVTELPSSPGARLRRERESRGLSQQQAAESLNLDPTVILHLEANDFAALGAPVFVKGHLRRYSSLLGLGDDEIVTLYERSKQQVGEPSLVPKSRLEMAPVRGKPRWPWVVGGFVSFLVAAALIAWVSEHGLPWSAPAEDEATTAVLQDVPVTAPASSADAAAAPATPAMTDSTTTGPATTGPATTPAFSSSPPTGATPGTAAATTTATVAAPALQPGQVSLLLKFSADSWVEVFDGTGKAVLYDLGKAGTERALTANGPLSVTLGNAAGVAVAVNGRALPPVPRAQGQPTARFSVAPDGTLR